VLKRSRRESRRSGAAGWGARRTQVAVEGQCSGRAASFRVPSRRRPPTEPRLLGFNEKMIKRRIRVSDRTARLPHLLSSACLQI
jgi:hypothetical protein